MYFEDQTYDGLQGGLPFGEYENCQFKNCDFQSLDFSKFIFIDCTFVNCNLTMVKTDNLALRDIVFEGSKLMGFRFDLCNTLGLSVSFTSCVVDHSSFFGVKVKKTRFKDSSLQSVDFTGADATEVVFENCNLADAHFERTQLVKADFRKAYNFTIDPEINVMKKARFLSQDLGRLLTKYGLDVS